MAHQGQDIELAEDDGPPLSPPLFPPPPPFTSSPPSPLSLSPYPITKRNEAYRIVERSQRESPEYEAPYGSYGM